MYCPFAERRSTFHPALYLLEVLFAQALGDKSKREAYSVLEGQHIVRGL